MKKIFVLLLVYVFCYCEQTERDRVYVVSDLHINNGILSEEEQSDLRLFFEYVSSDDRAKSLIFAGDFLEGWAYPVDESVTTFEEIIGTFQLDGTDLIKLLGDINAKKVDIIVVKGNHDQLLLLEDFNQKGLTNGKGLDVFDLEYTESNFLVEHGNQYDLFNYYDTKGDDFHPFGYIHSRLQESLGNYGGGEHGEELPTCSINHALKNEMATMGILLMAAFDIGLEEAIMTAAPMLIYEADVPEYLTQTVVGGCDYFEDEFEEDTTVIKSMTKQMTFYERLWKKITSEYLDDCFYTEFETDECKKAFHEMQMRAYSGFGGPAMDYFIANYLGDRDGLSLVFMGHAHEPAIRFVSRKDGKLPIVYANTGSWVEEIRSYGLITLNENGEAVEVDICQFTPDDPCIPLFYAEIPLTDDESIVVPEEWTCSREQYGDGEVCDCDCGAYDPDCLDFGITTNCYDFSPFLPTTCEPETLQCMYIRLPVPEQWTCDPEEWMNEDQICYCDCAVFDPICTTAYAIEGCDDSFYDTVCMQGDYGEAICLGLIPNEYIPFGMGQPLTDEEESKWYCPDKWFGSGDGCDCNCGLEDPDCNGTHDCSCW